MKIRIDFPATSELSVTGRTVAGKSVKLTDIEIEPNMFSATDKPVVLYAQVVGQVNNKEIIVQKAVLMVSGRSGQLSLSNRTRRVSESAFEQELAKMLATGQVPEGAVITDLLDGDDDDEDELTDAPLGSIEDDVETPEPEEPTGKR